jgi:hypothetical protein
MTRAQRQRTKSARRGGGGTSASHGCLFAPPLALRPEATAPRGGAATRRYGALLRPSIPPLLSTRATMRVPTSAHAAAGRLCSICRRRSHCPACPWSRRGSPEVAAAVDTRARLRDFSPVPVQRSQRRSIPCCDCFPFSH